MCHKTSKAFAMIQHLERLHNMAIAEANVRRGRMGWGYRNKIEAPASSE